MRSLDALANVEAGPEPRRGDYGPIEDYYTAWYLWRAVRRDAYLTTDEAGVVLDLHVDRIRGWQDARR